MGASGTGAPLFTAPFVAGTITISGTAIGVPQNLLALIQAQLDPNCPGTGYEVIIQADNSGPVYVGAQSPIKGPLSTTNYGYLLAAGSSGTSPGSSNTPRRFG